MILLSLAEKLALAATATAAAAATLADAALSPQSQLFGRTLIAGSNPSEIALTFDDGPNDAITPALLDLLAAHKTRATFFMIGRFVRQSPALARRVLAEGHLIGNHTMTHPWLAWQSSSRIREEMRRCNEALEDVLGAPVRYFRPPHGARRPAVLREARRLDMKVVQWNAMGKDWRPIGAEGILRNVRAGLTRAAERGTGANILLHDGGDLAMGTDRTDTLTAVAQLLAQLTAQGSQAVTIDAWG